MGFGLGLLMSLFVGFLAGFIAEKVPRWSVRSRSAAQHSFGWQAWQAPGRRRCIWRAPEAARQRTGRPTRRSHCRPAGRERLTRLHSRIKLDPAWSAALSERSGLPDWGGMRPIVARAAAWKRASFDCPRTCLAREKSQRCSAVPVWSWRGVATHVPYLIARARSKRPLSWADLAEDRLRLNRLCRNSVPPTFFPCRPGPSFLARQESSSFAVRPLRGAPSIASGLSIAIEAAMVRAR